MRRVGRGRTAAERAAGEYAPTPVAVGAAVNGKTGAADAHAGAIRVCVCVRARARACARVRACLLCLGVCARARAL